MKNHFLSFAVLMMGMSLLTACSDSDEGNHGKGYIPVTNGIYVVNAGTQNSIDGTLTYYDYTTGQTVADIFSAKNGRSLGDTPNDALRYGDKLYVVVDGEHTVNVLDAKTMKLLRAMNIAGDDMLGATDGLHPRRLAAYGDYVFISTYGGYVAAVDTITFQLQRKYKAGSYPEGIAVDGTYLYVANSDYSNVTNASISKINLSTGEETRYNNENIRNPQTIALAGTDIYFLDYGNYDENWNQANAGVYRINSAGIVTKVVPDATGMTAAGYNIYTYNAPYGGSSITYSIYNIQTGKTSSFTPAGIESPAAIEVDPITGAVMIASYRMKESEYGTFPDYSGNCYVNIYDSSFEVVKTTFECGLNPARIVINPSLKEVEY